jgi:hypothetical protein
MAQAFDADSSVVPILVSFCPNAPTRQPSSLIGSRVIKTKSTSEVRTTCVVVVVAIVTLRRSVVVDVTTEVGYSKLDNAMNELGNPSETNAQDGHL